MQHGLDMFWRQTCCVTCILPVIGSIISLLSHFEFISLVPCYDDHVDPVEHCLELPEVVDMEGRTEMIDEFVLINHCCGCCCYSMCCGCTPSYVVVAGIILPYEYFARALGALLLCVFFFIIYQI